MVRTVYGTINEFVVLNSFLHTIYYGRDINACTMTHIPVPQSNTYRTNEPVLIAINKPTINIMTTTFFCNQIDVFICICMSS